MGRFTFALSLLALVILAGCSGDAGSSLSGRVAPSGEKVVAGNLTYSVVDSQILAQLGEEGSPRVPRDRFLLVQIAVANNGAADSPIPAVELISDSGKTYSELTDGSGATDWLGLIRHIGSGRTVRGTVVFDAPAAHYRLRFNDETMNTGVLADLPLSYDHERDAITPTADNPDLRVPAGRKK